MFPARFAESSCLKCHHEVADLEPSQRFPEPPAPKVVEGIRHAGGTAEAIIRSILKPSEVITEGFSQQLIETDEGETFAGIVLEELGAL